MLSTMNKAAVLVSSALTLSVAASAVFADAADVSVFDWSGYEDAGFFGAYVEQYGGSPSYSFFGSEEEAYTKLRAGFTADLAHPCIGVTRKWADSGLISPIDTSRLRNWDALVGTLKNVNGIEFDGEVWMVPFDWGNSGLIYRTDKITADEISLELATDPAYQGKVAIPDAVTSAYAMAALAVGVRDWTNLTDAEFEAASDYLRRLHSNVLFYWTDPGQLDQALASGEIVMGWGWNQSELNLIWNETPAAMMKDIDKGVATWICGYVHLKDGSASDDQVYDMLNALTDAASGKYIIEAWGYAHSNSEAYDQVDPALIKQYGFDQAESFFSDSLLTSALDPEMESRMVSEFERIKAGF